MVTEYLLDTNVISELTRVRPDSSVARRFQVVEAQSAVSSVTWHELQFGVDRMPAGRRRDGLRRFLSDIGDRLAHLPYDQQAAEWHAGERARLESCGRTPSFMDGQIAATAATNGLRLVTRNVTDFRDFEGLTVESWWS